MSRAVDEIERLLADLNAPRRILLVDDEENYCAVLKANLEHGERCIVDCAGTGQAGIEKANAGNYHIIILDMRLPDISGLDVFETIRKNDEATPVVFLTGYPSDELKITASHRNAVVVPKPLNPDDLNIILKLLSGQ